MRRCANLMDLEPAKAEPPLAIAAEQKSRAQTTLMLVPHAELAVPCAGLLQEGRGLPKNG